MSLPRDPPQILWKLGDRIDDRVRPWIGRSELIAAELPGPHEHSADTQALGSGHIRFDVIAHHGRLLRAGAQFREGRLEIGRGRLADDLGVDPGRVLEPRDERAGIEERPACCLPPPVPVESKGITDGLATFATTKEEHDYN